MTTFLMMARAKTEESSCDLVTTTRGTHSHVVQLVKLFCDIKVENCFFPDTFKRAFMSEKNKVCKMKEIKGWKVKRVMYDD